MDFSVVSEVIRAFWVMLLKMSPWLLFGFLAAGVLSLFFTPEWVSERLGRRAGFKAILRAVLFGVPLPLCSCGVLPVATGLRKSGAGKGATAAFLISTPQTGVDSFFATYSVLGILFALVRPLVALITGLVGGLLVDRADDDPPPVAVTARSETPESAPLPLRLLGAVRYGLGFLLGNVAAALVIGLVLSALIFAFVPQDFFADHLLGSDWIAFPVMLLVGIPMYVCSTASIPVALALMAKGISPGAALIFLIVGPALNGASVTTLLKLLGKRCTALYLAVIAAGAVLAGILLNAGEDTFGLLPDFSAPEACCTSAHAPSQILQTLCAVLLLALLIFHLVMKPLAEKLFPKKSASAATRVTVSGLHCDHCRAAVTKLLSGYPGITRATVISPDSFEVEGLLPECLAADISELGFTLVSVNHTSSVRYVVVEGLRCDHCRAAVTSLLSGYPGVTRAVNVAPDTFEAEGLLPETLAADIAELGFTLKEVR